MGLANCQNDAHAPRGSRGRFRGGNALRSGGRGAVAHRSPELGRSGMGKHA